MKIPSQALEALQALKQADKYGADAARGRDAVADPVLKAQLSLKTNAAIDEFLFAAGKESTNSSILLRVMAKELAKFPNYLEMDERERVADYFEEIMDILGLESSGGMLENYVFGI